MDDLLKEAIADAKAVRETALENAKMALEEAFTPRLQNMLSQKIQTEMEDEDEKDMEEREDMMDADEDPSDEDSQEEMAMAMKDADEDPSDEDSEEMDESEIIEIDGVKYAPVVSEEEDEDEEDMDEMKDEDDEDMEEDLDLESVIKELESELDEAEENDDKEEVEEQSKSSGIGAGDNKVANASSGDEEDPGKGKLKEEKDEDDEEIDEDIDLDEVLKALSEEEDEDKEKNEVSELKSDLAEHRSVIETLRGKLNEVNLLNAKLLFTNKLFRKHGLNNEQKMKVVEQFDRASNLREVKLVYSTLGESFNARKNEINEHKGSASKPIASTKPEKEVITEGSDLRDRFKKLANLI
tara:strand:+ start:381 stop:1442 length:1062 start_codon:yes stop_codon:yes gene_type:complete